MKEIILKYDGSSVCDINGGHLFTLPLTDAQYKAVEKSGVDVVELVKLGVSPEDIIQMKNHGVL